MCMAAQVLTAMSAAVMGLDSPRRLMGLSPPGSSTTTTSNGDQAPSANIKAVRSWARESRRLVDLGRRVHGKADYLYLMDGVEVLGREESTSKSKSKSQPTENNKEDEEEGLDKDERLVRLDLKRIQEGNRRWKEAAFKQQVNSIGMKGRAEGNGGDRDRDRESAAVQVGKWGEDDNPGLKGNTICERTWAVVLYNTGMVEAVNAHSLFSCLFADYGVCSLMGTHPLRNSIYNWRSNNLDGLICSRVCRRVKPRCGISSQVLIGGSRGLLH